MRESRWSHANARTGGSSVFCEIAGLRAETVVMLRFHFFGFLQGAAREETERCSQDGRADAGPAQIHAGRRAERGKWGTRSQAACIRRSANRSPPLKFLLTRAQWSLHEWGLRRFQMRRRRRVCPGLFGARAWRYK